ncbi:PD-(D/E)XK motif protein [Streptomyces sp. SUK 48]|uniref:PD-(D/E)XK motif protein n=1 Tax=Streptomyces sp. SUK 48 TaxID=2582831 RepID=UPI00129AAE66
MSACEGGSGGAVVQSRAQEPQAIELPWTTVEHYLGRGLAASYRLSSVGDPLVSYEIADGGRGIALHVELTGPHHAPRSPLSAVRVDNVLHAGRRMVRLTTPEPELLRDFHDLALAVADRIVVEGRDLARAFDETVHGWSLLLGRTRGLSLERRLGLQGELAVLVRLAEASGWRAAIDAWVGPAGEEHDFALQSADLEIKTTAGERRRHTVHGLGQLEESPGRSLWFASLRVTRGGTGGRTLGESVKAARDAAAAESIASRARLDRLLSATGWNPDQPDDERWTPRDSPLMLRAADMPRLTPGDLPAAAQGRIDGVTYRVDVTELQPVAEPYPVDLSDLRLP